MFPWQKLVHLPPLFFDVIIMWGILENFDHYFFLDMVNECRKMQIHVWISSMMLLLSQIVVKDMILMILMIIFFRLVSNET